MSAEAALASDRGDRRCWTRAFWKKASVQPGFDRVELRRRSTSSPDDLMQQCRPRNPEDRTESGMTGSASLFRPTGTARKL